MVHHAQCHVQPRWRVTGAPQSSPESGSPGRSFHRAGLRDFSPERDTCGSRCGYSSTWRPEEWLRSGTGKWPGKAQFTCPFSTVQQRASHAQSMQGLVKSLDLFWEYEVTRPPREGGAVCWTLGGGGWGMRAVKGQVLTNLRVAGPCARVASASSAWFRVGAPAQSLAQR